MQNQINKNPTDIIVLQAIERKHEYTGISKIIDDKRLERAIRKDILSLIHDRPLTLLGCLTCEDIALSITTPVMHALDANILNLNEAGAIIQSDQLATKLLNREQYFNTQSELALARTLIERGWSVRLEEKFFGDKDVDIFAASHGESNFIEVTNLAISLLSESVRTGIIGEIDKRDMVVKKIVAKYRRKFEEPFAKGWCGRAWVALDVSKNHAQDLSMGLQSIVRNTWLTEIASHVQRECPKLAGFIVYSTRPQETNVGWLHCVNLA